MNKTTEAQEPSRFKLVEYFAGRERHYSKALELACSYLTDEQAKEIADAMPPPEYLAEQAEQEPVGYFAYDEEHDIWEELTGPNAPGATPLYTAPVRTKDLTDDEIMKINVDTASIVPTCDRQFHFARAVIAADRSKNAT